MNPSQDLEQTHDQGFLFIVDDDDDIRESLSMYLEMEGYEVQSAGGVDQAINDLKLLQRKPKLILLDMLLGKKNAPEFLRESLQEASLQKIPVILMSGNKIRKDRAKELGAVATLEKPFDLSQVKEILDQF